jgi:predicted AlkP superfamily pyrophosphatase or phosphodiesterase
MSTSSLVIVLDGLRPDYIHPETTPNLCDLRNRGVTSKNHHAVYPSKTRVNAASVATGCFPRSHGLVHNQFVQKELRNTPIDTSAAEDLNLVEKNTAPGILTTRSLGEILAAHDRDIFVAGSGTPGSTMLLNHTGRPD